MNQRIQSLLIQSGLQPYYDAQQGQIEKFAQLIVKECISVYERDPSVYHEVNIANILEHFGVEE